MSESEDTKERETKSESGRAKGRESEKARDTVNKSKRQNDTQRKIESYLKATIIIHLEQTKTICIKDENGGTEQKTILFLAPRGHSVR